MPLGMSARRFSALWLCGAVATVLLLGIFTATQLDSHGWLGYMRLNRRGQQAEGAVIRVEPGNHCKAEYSFQVARVTYHGSGADCSARVGEQVLVTYLVADPRESCLGLAKDSLANEVIPIILAGVFFPPLIILANLAKRRWREDEGAA